MEARPLSRQLSLAIIACAAWALASMLFDPKQSFLGAVIGGLILVPFESLAPTILFALTKILIPLVFMFGVFAFPTIALFVFFQVIISADRAETA